MPLFHKDIFLPEWLEVPKGLWPLKYSPHALEEAKKDNLDTFLLYDSTSAPEGLPAAVGKREGYDFAVNSENIKFFKDSRDIKFYNNVTGWVKDNPEKPFVAAK